MDYDISRAQDWLDHMREVEEPISNAVTTHLLVEYGLNFLLQEEASPHDEVVEVLQNNYPIAKAKLLWKIDVIPKELYDNVHKLNRIRNSLAHDLDADFSEVDLNFYNYRDGDLGDVDVSGFKDNFSNPPTREEVHEVMKWVSLLTFGWLHEIINDHYN
jgi:uncharacterized protein YutE (UPF0331/DUF86 family)